MKSPRKLSPAGFEAEVVNDEFRAPLAHEPGQDLRSDRAARRRKTGGEHAFALTSAPPEKEVIRLRSVGKARRVNLHVAALDVHPDGQLPTRPSTIDDQRRRAKQADGNSCYLHSVHLNTCGALPVNPNTVQVPYGVARRIVAAMKLGDRHFVRPQWIVSFHNAARRMGLRIKAEKVRRDGAMMYRITRIGDDEKSGHANRMPRRERATGRLIRGKVPLQDV